MSNDAYAYSSGALSSAMRVQDKIKVTEEQGIRANENTVAKVKMKELSVRGTSMGPIKTLTPCSGSQSCSSQDSPRSPRQVRLHNTQFPNVEGPTLKSSQQPPGAEEIIGRGLSLLYPPKPSCLQQLNRVLGKVRVV